MDTRSAPAISRLVLPLGRRGALPPPILALVCLLGLLGGVGGALKVREGLTVLSPTLRLEMATQDRELSRGSWPELLQKYRGLLETGLDAPDVHYLLGRLHARLGHMRPARVHFEEALELAPRHALALAGLAELLIRLERFEEAQAVLVRAEDVAGGLPEVALCRAALDVAQGRLDAALRGLRRLASRPDVPGARLLMARCLYLAGRLGEATERLQGLLMSEPRLSAARELLALVLVRQGRFDDAQGLLERLDGGQRCRAVLDVVRAVSGGSLPEEAAVAYFQAKALPVDTPALRINLLRRAAALAPTFAAARVDLARALAPSSAAAALAELRAVAAAAPTDPAVAYRLGLALHDAGDAPGAARELLRASGELTSDPELRVRLAHVLIGLRRGDEALVHLRRAIHLSPADPRPYVLVGRILVDRGETAAARDSLRQALLLDPYDDDASALLRGLSPRES